MQIEFYKIRRCGVSFLIYFLLISLGSKVKCQSTSLSVIDSIVSEGKYLYRLEETNKISKDIIVNKFPGLIANIGGYFSYPEKLYTVCVFYSRDTSIQKVRYRVILDSTMNISHALILFDAPMMNNYEDSLYRMKMMAEHTIEREKMMRLGRGEDFDVIPMRYMDVNKVYVLSSLDPLNKAIMGNDFLFIFGAKYQVIKEYRIHQKPITLPFMMDSTELGATSYHFHEDLDGDLITSTDVCNLMLYEKKAGWSKHLVISKYHVSVWDCYLDTLQVFSRVVWERMQVLQYSPH